MKTENLTVFDSRHRAASSHTSRASGFGLARIAGKAQISDHAGSQGMSAQMVYFKRNLPNWERVIRVVAGLSLVCVTLLFPVTAWMTWVGIVGGILFAESISGPSNA